MISVANIINHLWHNLSQYSDNYTVSHSQGKSAKA
jgi:hypothetical protein